MASGRIGLIVEATGCNEDTARKVEDEMRDVIYHSTLDWQTRDELEAAARTAYAVLQEIDADF